MTFDSPHWLSEEQQRRVVESMCEFQLFTKRDGNVLPLAGGGITDLYINLRNMRNSPPALNIFADVFAQPLSRLGIDRIAEVPQSLSPLAGLLAVRLQKPLVTIRDKRKPGRMEDESLIGEIVSGEDVGIVEDVITNGISKIGAYNEIVRCGATPVCVVLVDRQEGWERVFQENHINMPVWSGMTLDQLRWHLKKMGV